MTFTTQRLVDSRMLVSGTDITGTAGKCTLDTTQWDEVKLNKEFSEATADFDAAVSTFFAPLDEAMEKLEAAGTKPEPDPTTFVVLQEEVVGQVAEPARLIKLNHDSIVLRLLEQGNTNRLVWVDDYLEILEANAAPVAPVSGLIQASDVPTYTVNEGDASGTHEG